MIEIFDRAMHRIGSITDAWDQKQTLALNAAGEFSFSLAMESLSFDTLEMEANQAIHYLKHNTFIRYRDEKEDRYKFSGVPVQIEKEEKDNGETIAHVKCYGMLYYLKRTNVRVKSFVKQSPQEIIQSILGEQEIPLVRMGFMEGEDLRISHEFSYEDLYTAILNVIEMIGGDFTVDPHTLRFYQTYEQGGIGPTIRYQENMEFLRVVSDNTQHFTRIIPLGYGEGINQLTIEKVNGGRDYLDAPPAIMEEYGVIEQVWVDKRYKHAESLLEGAKRQLEEHQLPSIAYETDMIHLWEWEDEWGEQPYQDQEPELGDWIRILNPRFGVDSAERVVKIERNLDENKRHMVSIELSERTKEWTDVIQENHEGVKSFQQYDQGSTFISSYNLLDNIDQDFPATMRVYIDPRIMAINYAKLSFHPDNYRGFTKAIQGGGGSTVTSAAGGSTNVTSASGGGSSTTSASGGEHRHVMFQSAGMAGGGLAKKRFFGYFPGDSASAAVDLESVSGSTMYTYSADGNHTHSVQIPSHTHNVSIPSHTHSITIPEHTHPIEFGIFEGPAPSAITVKVNGKQVASSSSEQRDIEIAEHLSIGQWNEIEFSCNGLARVDAVLNVQQFIQTK